MLRRDWLLLTLALLAGLGLRLALWEGLPRQGMISDEAEYLAAAAWLAEGRGFAWHQGWLWTRAPLYPLFLAAHIRFAGLNLEPIFLSQTVLSLLHVGLVYVLARQVVGQAVGAALLATLLAALYLPFAAYPQMLLSETLYMSLLLAGFVALGCWCRGRAALLPVAVAGGLFGLATLTRGLTLGFLPLVALWLWWVGRRAGKADGWVGLRAALLFVLVCAGTILPWSLYASRAYGGPVLVDTTGGFNLLLGARTAYDGKRSDAPTRHFVLALLDARLTGPERRTLLASSCLWQRDDPGLRAALERPPTTISQAERQRLLLAEGLCLLQARPGAFVVKSATELVDLFQINYTGAERMSGGFSLGRLPRWYTLALFLLDDTLYVLLLPLAVIGWSLTRSPAPSPQPPAAPPSPASLTSLTNLTNLIGLWWLYNLLAAPLLFAINRFRIPLLPFACIYAALVLCLLVTRLRARQGPPLRGWPRVHPGAATLAGLLALLALAPHAYLQAAPAAWASYLGPYPSSLANTLIAWQTRPTHLHEQHLIAALGHGDAQAAHTLLASGPVTSATQRLARPLLAGLEGQPRMGLALLPPTRSISATRDWRAAVVRGDLLRRLGNQDAARAAFTPGYVDDQNPVDWAWRWLSPPPTSHIDLGGNLDLGYIAGFYLGEGDQSAAGRGTFRWSGPRAALRFPGQGRAGPQIICLRLDGRGWPSDQELPRVRLALAAAEPFAVLPLTRGVVVACAELPPTTPGADLIVELASPVFVPPAADLLAQQGPQAGQLRLLGVRLDWASLAPLQPGRAVCAALAESAPPTPWRVPTHTAWCRWLAAEAPRP